MAQQRGEEETGPTETEAEYAQKEPGDEPTPRLAPDFAGSPEFRSAVDSAVQNLLPELMARLAVAQSAPGAANASADSADAKGMLSGLALQLAQLTGQGEGRVYVAPEIIEFRHNAMERMTDLILELHARGEIPAYTLRNKVFLNLGPRKGEMLIDPFYRDNEKIMQPQEIDWPGVPNLAMEPLNEAARRVFGLFCEAVGHQGAAQGPDRLWGLSQEGVILRGGPGVLAADRDRQLGEPGLSDNPEMPAAGIRRKDKAPTRKVQVLGSLTAPVEVA